MDVASPTPENQCLDGHSSTFMLTPNKDGRDICGLAQGIHQVLPQTQCRRCGEQDCFAYAQAIAQRKAPINRCPPGGKEGMVRIAQAMGNLDWRKDWRLTRFAAVKGPWRWLLSMKTGVSAAPFASGPVRRMQLWEAVDTCTRCCQPTAPVVSCVCWLARWIVL